MDGESNGGLENNSPNGWTDGELNDQLENNSPNRWTDVELNGRLENNQGGVLDFWDGGANVLI